MSEDAVVVDMADRITEAYYGLIPDAQEDFRERTRRRVHWICAQARGGSILDIGCSQGLMSILLAREGKKCLGLDANAKSIEQALEYLRAEPDHVRDNVVFVHADAVLHDYAGQKFDTILLGGILERQFYPARLLDLAARLLAPNGRLVVAASFGMQAFSGYTAVYYGKNIYELLRGYFSVEDVIFSDAWSGFIATNGESAQSLQSSSVWSKTEDAFLVLEQSLRTILFERQAQLDALKKQYTKLESNYIQRVEEIAALAKISAGNAQETQAKIQKGQESHPSVFGSLLRLPGKLFRIHRESARRKKLKAILGKVPFLLEEKGSSAVKALVDTTFANSDDRAASFGEVARQVRKDNLEAAIFFVTEAIRYSPSPSLQKWAAFLEIDAGFISKPYEVLSSLSGQQRMSASEKNKMAYISGCYKILTNPLPGLDTNTYDRSYEKTKRVIYMAASSLPHHITGYTIRTHALLQALTAKGFDMLCLTRPGYPQDRPDAIQPAVGAESIVICQGIPYGMIPGPHRRKTPLDVYFAESVEQIAARIEQERPSIIHAASNYEVAYPALLAAKRYGIPFIYEVRGLWEYTGLANRNSAMENECFQLDKKMESFVVRHADHVFTLTRQLAAELEKRGASPHKVSLLPNAIDPAALSPSPRDENLARQLGLGKEDFVIGYIGSIVPYEGLDDLIRAMTVILPRHTRARLVIVGDGQQLQTLRALAQEHGIEKEVIFTGKVPHDTVASYYSLLHTLALPRKPYEVCRLVSPLKPFEAMCMKIPLVVSDVDALKDMVQDNETALVCEAGDHLSLADCLMRLIENEALRNTLKENAYDLVVKSHIWAGRADDVSAVYSHFMEISSYPGKNVITALI